MDIQEANLIVGLFRLILDVVSKIPKNPRNRPKGDKEALIALSDAYHSTIKYYEFLKNHPRDVGTETDIAQKWDTVGVLLKEYDETLAVRLDAKSRYWREGATWSDEVIRQAGIGLENIRREVRLRIEQG